MKLLDFSLRDPKLASQLFEKGAVAVPCLQEADRIRLLHETEELLFTVAEVTFHSYGAKHESTFSELNFGSRSPFTILRYALEERVKEERSAHFFDGFTGFNEVRIHYHPPNSRGNGIHRDQKRYRNLVAVIVLESSGEFATYRDRDGTGKWVVPHEAGDAIFMRMPGFMCTTDAPFHSLSRVTDERVVITYRQESKKPA